MSVIPLLVPWRNLAQSVPDSLGWDAMKQLYKTTL